MGRTHVVLLLAAALSSTLAGWDTPQDRVDLPERIESWYRVLQGKRTIGYARELLQRARKAPWRFEYSYDLEFELTVNGKPRSEELSVTGLIEESLNPGELAIQTYSDDSAASLWLHTAHEDRRVEVRPPGAKEAAAWTVPARDDVHLLPALTLYGLCQNGSLARPGRVALRALDPRGEEKSGVEAAIEVGDPVRRDVLGKEGFVTPVTFLKPLPSAARDLEIRQAWIDRTGRIVEAILAGGARIVLAKDAAGVLAEVGPIHRHGRRDPMDKMEAMRNTARERAQAQLGGEEIEWPAVTLDSLASDLAAARKMADELRTLKAADDVDLARTTFLKALVRLKVIRELALRRRPELLPEVDQVWEGVHSAWDGAARIEREAREQFVQIAGQVDRLECEAVEQTLQTLQAFRDRLEVERRPERDTIAAWVAEAGAIAIRCRTRRDLARTRLEVTGITIGEIADREVVDSRIQLLGQEVGARHEVPFVRPLAMTEINGRIYREGDVVEGTRIRVEKIFRHGVRVSLRDELREVGLRR